MTYYDNLWSLGGWIAVFVGTVGTVGTEEIGLTYVGFCGGCNIAADLRDEVLLWFD